MLIATLAPGRGWLLRGGPSGRNDAIEARIAMGSVDPPQFSLPFPLHTLTTLPFAAALDYAFGKIHSNPILRPVGATGKLWTGGWGGTTRRPYPSRLLHRVCHAHPSHPAKYLHCPDASFSTDVPSRVSLCGEPASLVKHPWPRSWLPTIPPLPCWQKSTQR